MDQKMVKSPAHYTEGRKFEPKDVIRDWGLGFNLGSTVKYIARAGRKDDILQELYKAKEFLQFEIEAIEAERAKQIQSMESKKPPYGKGSGVSFEDAIKHSEQMEKEKDIKIDEIPLQHHEGVMFRIAVPVEMDPEEAIKRFISQLYGGR